MMMMMNDGVVGNGSYSLAMDRLGNLEAAASSGDSNLEKPMVTFLEINRPPHPSSGLVLNTDLRLLGLPLADHDILHVTEKRRRHPSTYDGAPISKRRRIQTRSMTTTTMTKKKKKKKKVIAMTEMPKPKVCNRFFVPKLDTEDNRIMVEKFPHLIEGMHDSHVLFSLNGVRYEMTFGMMKKYRCVDEIVRIIHEEIPNIPINDIIKAHIRKNERTIVLCAEDEETNEIVGGLLYRTHKVYPFAELLLLAVTKKYQRARGIGSTLVDQMKELIPPSIYAIFVDSDYRAIPFYEKNGFSENITIPAMFTEMYERDLTGSIFDEHDDRGTEPRRNIKQAIWDTTYSVRMECRRIRGEFALRKSLLMERRENGLFMQSIAHILQK